MSNRPIPGSRDFDGWLPQAEEITVTVERFGLVKGLNEFTLTKQDFFVEELLDCGNPQCENGGIRVWSLVLGAIKRGETDAIVEKVCGGRKGRHGGPCMNSFRIQIHVVHKSA